jgi:hypothetical protein
MGRPGDKAALLAIRVPLDLAYGGLGCKAGGQRVGWVGLVLEVGRKTLQSCLPGRDVAANL